MIKMSHSATGYHSATEAYGAEPKQLESDDRDVQAIDRDLEQSGERFGRRPDHLTVAQLGALQKLHLNLSHPSAQALRRRLKAYGVPTAILDAVDKLNCSTCAELSRPKSVRTANLKLSTEFNENVLLDEAEVILSDNSRLLVMIIIDDASSFRTIIPTKTVRSITCRESLKCFRRGRLAWAGPPKTLYYDAAKGHPPPAIAELGDKYNILMRPAPA